jgi:hypothetical protein|tara:strand:+ start:238 stop:672 length:435 start_codon:yes stop_codon:yes gene_type:complete
MNIESLRTMVQLDLEIDESNLHTESIKTPQLHNKYLVFYQNSKLELEKLELEEKILKKDKWLYYTGKIGQDDLESYGWEPFDYNILKTDVPMFIDADKDIQKIRAKNSLQRMLVDYLENVIKIITGRQWSIKSAIEWIKFTQGI